MAYTLRSAALAPALAAVWAIGVAWPMGVAGADVPQRSTIRLVAATEPDESSEGPQLLGGADEPIALEPQPPQVPTMPRAPLGGEILQDELPPHESVVEPAPPVYIEGRPQGPIADGRRGHDVAATEHYAPPGYHSRLQHHPLRSYLENRPRQMQLQADSWLNRPFGMSYFLGGMFLDDPIPGVVGGDPGFTYGARLNYDLGPHWGVETRIIGSSVGVQDQLTGTDLDAAALFQWDVNWLWYWTGDTRWRPYFLVGTGLLDIDYFSIAQRYHTTVFELPFGVGLKYRHSTRLALRFELLDNYAFSSGVQSDMHNVSLTAGMELRFGGGRSRSYWPWNPGRNWW